MRLSSYPGFGSRKWAQQTVILRGLKVIRWMNETSYLDDPFDPAAPDGNWGYDNECHGCDKKSCVDCNFPTTF